MENLIESVKRFTVVLVTESILLLIAICLMYILYTKNCNIADIVGLMTLIIFGIVTTGCGYIGVKAFENYKDIGGKNGTNA